MGKLFGIAGFCCIMNVDDFAQPRVNIARVGETR